MTPGDRIVAVRPVTDLLVEPGGAELVTQARLGDVAEVLRPDQHPLPPEGGEGGGEGGWIQVRLLHDSHAAWAPANAFVPGSWPPPGASVSRVASLFANLHDAPSVRSRLLAVATLGTPVVPLDAEQRDGGGAGWRRVRLPGESSAWALAGDLCPGSSAWSWNAPADLRAGVVRAARRLLGLPYRWGGNTPFGIDCSGLIQLVFRLHGVELPHNARQQADDRRAVPIEREDCSGGDLIFFGGYTHVGLAVSNAEFIHATTHGTPGVQVSRLDDPAWSSRLDSLRRLRIET